MGSFKKPDEILREFFLEQSYELYSKNTRLRRSVLIELERDLQFSIGLPGRLKKTGLVQPKEGTPLKDLPTVSPLLIYCSAIDVLARAYHKSSTPPKGKNGKWFRESAELFFGYSKPLSKALLDLRNSLSHSYSINGFVFTSGHWDSELPIKKMPNEKSSHLVSSKQCLTNLRKARVKAMQVMMEQSPDEISATAEYVSEHFIYYLVQDSDLALAE
jgi:hypothetical protein